MAAEHSNAARPGSSYTCLPSAVLDPNCDPSSVDFRNFFPYVPNEVKHRKRTTRDQQKVLEGVFETKPKPDSALRQKLAKELRMTPRGVQVWFQNRRAKEKSVGKKAITVGAEMTTPDLSNHAQSPPPKEEIVFEADLPRESNSSPPSYNSADSSPASSPKRSPEIPLEVPSQHGPPRPNVELLNLRRGSLPIITRPPLPQRSSSNLNGSPAYNLLRRGSVEKLQGNPYARIAKTRPRQAPYHPRPTLLRESHDEASLHDSAQAPPQILGMGPGPFDRADPSRQVPLIAGGPDRSRPMLGHRASMPHVFSGSMERRGSLPIDMHAHIVPSSFRMPDSSQLYAISSRPVPAPTSGPLPSPNFTFGHPADSPSTSSPAPEGDYHDQVSELQCYSFGRRASEHDLEDDATSAASYDNYSRFGSIASMAGSESSNTSAYYSDVGSCNEPPSASWSPEARRGSYASSAQFSELLGGLELNHGHHTSSQDPSAGTMGASAEDLDEHGTPLGTASYPSPSSTVSPVNSHGNSPHSKDQMASSSTHSLPISGSSELAHALQTNHETKTWEGGYAAMTESTTITDLSSTRSTIQYNTQHIYGQPTSGADSIYDQSTNNASGSSLDLPLAAPHPQLGPLDNHSIPYHPFRDQSQSQYHHGYSSLPSSTEGQFSSTGTYSPPGQDTLELHHAMELRTSGYVGSDVNMGYVTSAVENTLQHPIDTYLQYS